MAYRALLFCPDEKAARTVTQVLGELEFTVEPCIEPFAAVKRLMGEHFDAVVVDCDNEQNATLLFKSARNSTSNQASLAVAVVEGQAGVAKAFRIGANLVLTKPINIEQSKGTLRVARGLLRKGEPAKPASPVATTPTPAAAKPAAPKPVAPAKPAAPATPSAVAAPPAPVPQAPKPAASPAFAATASSTPSAHDHFTSSPDISGEANSAAPAPPAPRLPAPGQGGSIDITSGFKNTPGAAATFGGGAASAPAPAREAQTSHVAPPPSPAKEADLFGQPAAEAATGDAHSSSAAPTAFTFGGANVPAESSAGGSKKVLLAVAAAVIVAAGLYVGWTYYQGHTNQPTTQTTGMPPLVPFPQPTKPAAVVPKATSAAPSTSSAVSSSQPAAQAPADITLTGSATDKNETASDSEDASPEKPSGSASTAAKAAASGKSGTLVVKGGSAPSLHTKAATPDAPAPSLIGMTAAGSAAPPPNLGSSTMVAPKPVLQTLNISQGVSQGLLMKKVQPQYPRNALAMHVEGSVDLMATISTTGNITAVKILKGDQLLTHAAADAVKQWKYKPYLLNGEPVEIQTEVTVNFKLPH